MDTFDPGTVTRWRAWLEKHHASASEVWLIFHKQHTGAPTVDYLEALDEALCYGWIDSLVKRIDDDRYARKFTPRKPTSKWSPINRRRYAALEAAGRLAPAGKERSPKGAPVARPPTLTIPAKLPAYIARGFKSVPAAWEHFKGLTPREQHRYVVWIHMAKQQTTRERRLRQAVAMLKEKRKLGLK